jgi:hypothetical protein
MPGEAPKKGGDQWKFDSAAVVGWLRERERQNALGEIAQIDEGEGRRRKIAAEAGLAEIELAKADGAAVSVADFGLAWASMIGAARAKLLGLGAKLGRVVALSDDPAECSSQIDAAVSEALQELSEFEPQIQIDSEGDSESEGGNVAGVATVGTSAGPDRQRMGGRGEKAERRVKR